LRRKSDALSLALLRPCGGPLRAGARLNLSAFEIFAQFARQPLLALLLTGGLIGHAARLRPARQGGNDRIFASRRPGIRPAMLP